jgi:predicted nucleic acid-binding protein
MIVDANIVLSAILGSAVRLERAVERGLELIIPDAQLFEAVKVLTRKLGVELGAAKRAVTIVAERMTVLESESLLFAEGDARARLGPRGQPDWPVLAAAMVLDGHIWSKDRDFVGVGVPVWSTRNIGFAGIAPQG